MEFKDWKYGHQVGVVDGQPCSCGSWEKDPGAPKGMARECWVGAPLTSAYNSARERRLVTGQLMYEQHEVCRRLPRPIFLLLRNLETKARSLGSDHRTALRSADEDVSRTLAARQKARR